MVYSSEVADRTKLALVFKRFEGKTYVRLEYNAIQ